MFEMTGSAAEPLTVRATFWQCFKAGAGFALGAMLVAVPMSFIMYALWVRILIAVVGRL